MAKFYGNIGFVTTEETAPDVWTPVEVKRLYSGNVIQNSSKWSPSNQLNDDVNIADKISIISDTFVENNIHNIRYVEWKNARWKVTYIDVQRPRLYLTLGGVYNG